MAGTGALQSGGNTRPPESSLLCVPLLLHPGPSFLPRLVLGLREQSQSRMTAVGQREGIHPSLFVASLTNPNPNPGGRGGSAAVTRDGPKQQPPHGFTWSSSLPPSLSPPLRGHTFTPASACPARHAQSTRSSHKARRQPLGESAGGSEGRSQQRQADAARKVGEGEPSGILDGELRQLRSCGHTRTHNTHSGLLQTDLWSETRCRLPQGGGAWGRGALLNTEPH